ncbi:flagellar hook capping FlgD N-terminal domain-containing protein [Gephyromycinifex aptenodytis]|uniref:flagellar hook capping FlgD N-terminal domain-containing protein n=1 Tax=Gephyromycinifex aptenodytis TaxID=2716227 RepID=UPI0014470E22|nr:flagellar hook capping FlgD N-terminal domain-containing protein [Gephyromycinifex aptenodytis]
MTVQPTGPAPAGATTGTTSPQYVTIKQPDGSSYRIPMAKATWDPATGTWASAAPPEANELAKTINRKHGQALDADDFMKLLVAQMRYQDPSKPADTTAMMQQTASMAMLERVNEMTTSAESMAKAAEKLTASNNDLMAYYATQRVEQRMSAAVGLIGANISFANPADASQTLDGVVETVKFDESGPILIVGGTSVPLGSVKSVKAPASAPAPAPAPAPTEPGPATGTTPAPAPTTPAPAPSAGDTDTSGSTAGAPATDGTATGTGTTGPTA